MRLTERIKQKRFAPGEGVTEAPPEQGIKRFFFVLATHPWKLVTLNMLFLAFCVPILTIPAALCGMNKVLIKLTREGNCFLWSDFIKEFRACFLKSLLFGALSVILLFDVYYMLGISMAAAGSILGILMAAAGLILFGFAVLFSGYGFALLPALDLKSRHIAKNAFIFMMTEWRTNLVILGSVLAAIAVAEAFFPYSIFLLSIIGFSFLQLIICTAVNGPLQKRIIGPYERMQKEGFHNG